MGFTTSARTSLGNGGLKKTMSIYDATNYHCAVSEIHGAHWTNTPLRSLRYSKKKYVDKSLRMFSPSRDIKQRPSSPVKLCPIASCYSQVALFTVSTLDSSITSFGSTQKTGPAACMLLSMPAFASRRNTLSSRAAPKELTLRA